MLELKEYIKNSAQEKDDVTILTGDLNAERNLVDPIFNNFQSIASHYSHITLSLDPKEKYFFTIYP